ncbi:MAG: ribonucleoside-diphosphate reductase beta chain [Thermoleophilaceae bacterium]|nr:ribonucleoside-diphosphate reductase beta chain [Thermoleophilaceae bacterium]
MESRTRTALDRMSREDPELAARLVLQTLPAAASRIDGPLAYDLELRGLGAWRVSVPAGGHSARVERLAEGAPPDGVAFALVTDAGGLARIAAGANPLRMMLGGGLKVRGSKMRARKLSAMSEGPEPTIAEALAAGAELDADAIFRSLAYLIDPEWTRGHSFTLHYEVVGEGEWVVTVADGAPVEARAGAPDSEPDTTFTLDSAVYRRLLLGEISPNYAMSQALARVRGNLYAATLMGRWIDRAQGHDDAELEREVRQREVQDRRAGSWGGSKNGRVLPAARPVAAPADGGDPAHESAGDARRGGDLMGYGELYALWERQNWKAHELDFSVDKEQWLATPTEAQQHTIWSLGSFYIGEERVTADLAPFLLAAPSGEVEIFLATQLVDEARHAAFFDRFGGEVMALGADDLRGRMRELTALMNASWFDVFDGGLRDIANRIKERPDDLDLFVEGITTYHMVIEGVLAMTGQRFILKYMEDHGVYPGFQKGFGLVEQDEHRHIAFGVRFLKEMVESDSRYGKIVQRRIEELVPRAVHVFVPPYVDSASDFISYDWHSSHIYGYAYRKLKRRMAVLGLDVPPAEDLMPGPIASPEESRAAGAPV